MRILLALALLAPFTALADDHPLNGTWTGSGTLDTAGSSTKSRFELVVKQTDTSLSLHECWFQPEKPLERSCIDSTYALEDTYKIIYEGRRIGEAYTWSIHIFLGEPMVSEQMVLEVDEKGALSYRYVYANYDGQSIVRKAELSK